MFPRAVVFEMRMRSFEPRAPVITKTPGWDLKIRNRTEQDISLDPVQKSFPAKFSFFLLEWITLQFSYQCCPDFW